MSDARRLLSFPTTDETYADRLIAANARVQRALTVLRTERESLAALLRLIAAPEERTH